MFRRLVSFLNRHKKKFLVVGGVIGGMVILNRYIGERLSELRLKQARDYIERLKMQRHFDGTLQNCDATVLSLSPKVRQVVGSVLDADTLLEAIKKRPVNRLALWEELKVTIFARAVGEVYCECLFVVFMRVHTSVLSGYRMAELQRDTSGPVQNVALTEVQQQYLACIQYYFDTGLKNLLVVVKDAVHGSVGHLGLKEKLLLKDFLAIFDDVQRNVSGESPDAIPRVGQYVLPRDVSGLPKELASVVARMLSELRDVLESADFTRVFSCCVEHGISMLMDRLSDCFVGLHDGGGFKNPYDIGVPLAKLLPLILDIVRCRPQDDGSLVQHLLQLDMLKAFAANVYEAFCQPLNPDDIFNHNIAC